MKQIAITFGLKYNDPETNHWFDPRITGHTYMVFSGCNWNEARAKANKLLAKPGERCPDFAFDYDLNDFLAEQVEKYDYVRFIPDEKTQQAHPDINISALTETTMEVSA